MKTRVIESEENGIPVVILLINDRLRSEIRFGDDGITEQLWPSGVRWEIDADYARWLTELFKTYERLSDN